MQLFYDAVIAGFIVLFICVAIWRIQGYLLFSPMGTRECTVILWVEEDGQLLEQQLRRLTWLHNLSPRSTQVLVARRGLSDAGITMANELSKRWNIPLLQQESFLHQGD